MKKLVLAIVFLIMFTISPALGQDNTSNQMITLETDKSIYYENDIITITGNVQKVVADQPIIIQVFFEETNKYFRITPDKRNLNYENYFEKGEMPLSSETEYNSENAYRLNTKEMINTLLESDYIKRELMEYN